VCPPSAGAAGHHRPGLITRTATFRQAVEDGAGLPTEAMLGVMRATIKAANRASAS
jgi:hypothetical protein